MEPEQFFDSFQSLAPKIGHDILLEASLLPLCRNAFDQRFDTTFVRVLDNIESVCTVLAGCTSLSPPIVEQLSALLSSLESKIRATPPFPTTTDHWVLGVLRLVVTRDFEGALSAFANGGSIVSRGVGLTARVEALYALKRFDMVVASVIEVETSEGVLATSSNEGEEKKKSFAAKALQRVSSISSSLRGIDAISETEAVLLQTEEDQKILYELPLLRRALAYHELDVMTGNNVYKFKCSQDFAGLFQRGGRPESMTALLKASKALITENTETRCALFHQASQANPRMWEFPYFSSLSRNRCDPKAMTDCEAALRLCTDNKLVRMHKILLMIEQKRVVEALKELHSLVLADPSNVWLGLLRGRARMLSDDDWEGAEADFRRVMSTLEKGEVGNNRAKGRLYCELAMMMMRRAKDPEAERLGKASGLQQTAKELLTMSVAIDHPNQHFAYRLRAQLQTDGKSAADDLWEAARAQASRGISGSDEWKEATVAALKAARKAYKKINDQQEVAKVANFGISLFKDSFWMYCLALASFSSDDTQKAAKICLEALEMSPSEKERVALEGLLLRCEIFDTSPASNSPVSRPAVVPPLQLNVIAISKPRTRRNKTDRAEKGRLRKSKQASTTDQQQQQQQQEQQEQQQQQQQREGAVESTNMEQANIVEGEKVESTARELELMAEVAALKEQLAAANSLIEQLKSQIK